MLRPMMLLTTLSLAMMIGCQPSDMKGNVTSLGFASMIVVGGALLLGLLGYVYARAYGSKKSE